MTDMEYVDTFLRCADGIDDQVDVRIASVGKLPESGASRKKFMPVRMIFKTEYGSL